VRSSRKRSDLPHRCGPAIGKIPLNLAGSTIDMLSLSGHNFMPPKDRYPLPAAWGPVPTLLVGGHQEKNRRAGTENTASIIALEGVRAGRPVAGGREYPGKGVARPSGE